MKTYVPSPALFAEAAKKFREIANLYPKEVLLVYLFKIGFG